MDDNQSVKNFTDNLEKNQKNLNPEFVKLVNENFDKLLDEEIPNQNVLIDRINDHLFQIDYHKQKAEMYLQFLKNINFEKGEDY